MARVETAGATPAAIEGPCKSYWQEQTARTAPATLNELPCDCDVVIVGGGLAGLSTAIGIMEMSPFAKVSVLEAAFVGYGASGRSGGLMSPLAAPVWLLSAQNNTEHAWAIKYLRSLVDEAAAWIKHAIPESEIKSETLTLESMGKLTGLGLEALSGILEHANIGHRLGANPARPGCDALSMACHTVNPFGLVQGLARHARALGVKIYEGIQVERIEDCVSGAYILLAGGHAVCADTVVVCTNAYSDQITMARKARGKVVSNYMLATKPLSAETQAMIAKSGRFTVELNGAYVFYRLHEGRLLFGGIDTFGQPGSGFHVPAEILAQLEALMQQSFPGIEPLEIAQAWGGQYHLTATDLPEIRRLPQLRGGEAGSIVMNTGYGGTGIALTLAMGARVAALALRQPAVEPDDERLHDIMQATRLPLAGIARHVAKIGWVWATGVLKKRHARHSPGSLGTRPNIAAMG